MEDDGPREAIISFKFLTHSQTVGSFKLVNSLVSLKCLITLVMLFSAANLTTLTLLSSVYVV